MQQPSKYLPIWNALKQNHICRITAPIIQHKKIIKMVRRTRDKDTEYLYELAEKHKTNLIRAEVSHTVITFRLFEYLTTKGI